MSCPSGYIEYTWPSIQDITNVHAFLKQILNAQSKVTGTLQKVKDMKGNLAPPILN